jgi:hypothetical protein
MWSLEGRVRRTKLRYALLAVVLAACGGVTTTPTEGSESHFLRECDEDCGKGLECVSGLCTRSCLIGRDSCADLASDAQCTDRSIEPGAVAVCDVGCQGDAACAKLGADFACDAGFCRAAGSSSGGAAGATSSGGSGGATSSSGSGGATSSSGSAGTGNVGGTGQVPPWQPPALCALPFDSGVCLALLPMWAAVDGECVSVTYGGCGGNDNRFSSLAECLATCQGAPTVNACPEGHEARQQACLECAPGLACSKLGNYCLQRCDAETPCDEAGFSCVNGLCEVTGCF